jgi:NodT family efflux transporter outer membrane factor (OMF) lipoprotein
VRIFKTLTPVICLALTACMVGPDYHEPKTQAMDHWVNKNAPIKSSSAQNILWWKSFHDPVLTQLIEQGYHNNLSLQSAGVRVLQARAQLAQSVGQLYPQQQAATGDYTYNRIGQTSLASVLPPTFDTASAGFSLNWELDFWGKYRRAIRSNDAAFLASFAAYDNALITLTSDIASAYIKLRTDEAQIKTTKTNIQVQATGLRIARARFQAGQTDLMDVAQAQTEYSQTEASLPPLIADLQRQKDALAVLLGTTPDKIESLLKIKGRIPKAPGTVTVGIPKEILARRPDIYEARMQALAESESIGATKAELYPAFSLAGTFSFTSNNINGGSTSDIFQWSHRSITAGPSFNWPLLNYGQITNAVRGQDAAFQQALFNYMNTVLKAQQEVQDNITSFVQANKAFVSLVKANRSALQEFKLALIRYKEGEIDFTPVLNAEQQLLKVQTSLIDAEGNIPSTLVALYRSLGGGWEIRCGNDIVSESTKKEMAARTNWGTLLKPENHLPPKTRSQQFNQLYLPKW